MIKLNHWRDLSLRVQLMLVFALSAIATTAVSTVALTTLTSQRSYKELGQRSARIARRLQLQLEPAVAHDDHQTAREILDSYAGSELDGMGVYQESGELIEGRGERPSQLLSIAEPLPTDTKHVVIVANIHSRENRNGRLYLRFSTAQIDAAERREVGVAAVVGASISVCAIFLAIWTSRRISRRVVTIADAAKRMTNGDSTVLHGGRAPKHSLRGHRGCSPENSDRQLRAKKCQS